MRPAGHPGRDRLLFWEDAFPQGPAGSEKSWDSPAVPKAGRTRRLGTLLLKRPNRVGGQTSSHSVGFWAVCWGCLFPLLAVLEWIWDCAYKDRIRTFRDLQVSMSGCLVGNSFYTVSSGSATKIFLSTPCSSGVYLAVYARTAPIGS